MRLIIARVILGAICIISLLYAWQSPTSLPASVQAAPPPRPTVTPRPTATPTPMATDEPDEPGGPKPPVATLLLRVEPKQDGLWSVVQWQAPSGNWRDVEGWRGTVVNGKTIWWVEAKDFGKAPFRWIVYQEDSRSPLAISQLFQLPDLRQGRLEIIISLPKPTGDKDTNP